MRLAVDPDKCAYILRYALLTQRCVRLLELHSQLVVATLDQHDSEHSAMRYGSSGGSSSPTPGAKMSQRSPSARLRKPMTSP